MRFPYANVKWNLNIHHFLRSVCVSVGQTINCAKTAEPIEMLFGMWTRVSPPKEPCINGGGSEYPGGNGQFRSPMRVAFCQNFLTACLIKD